MPPKQPSATSPLFLDNLHFGQIAKSVNLDWWLTLLEICPKWRLSKKRGLVADGCSQTKILETETAGRACLFEVLCEGVSTRRVPLLPLFDKPAFSRFSQHGEPQIGIEIVGKIVKRRVCQKGGGVAHAWYSHPRKVPRTDTSDLLFRFPKSSFGSSRRQRGDPIASECSKV